MDQASKQRFPFLFPLLFSGFLGCEIFRLSQFGLLKEQDVGGLILTHFSLLSEIFIYFTAAILLLFSFEVKRHVTSQKVWFLTTPILLLYIFCYSKITGIFPSLIYFPLLFLTPILLTKNKKFFSLVVAGCLVVLQIVLTLKYAIHTEDLSLKILNWTYVVLPLMGMLISQNISSSKKRRSWNSWSIKHYFLVATGVLLYILFTNLAETIFVITSKRDFYGYWMLAFAPYFALLAVWLLQSEKVLNTLTCLKESVVAVLLAITVLSITNVLSGNIESLDRFESQTLVIHAIMPIGMCLFIFSLGIVLNFPILCGIALGEILTIFFTLSHQYQKIITGAYGPQINLSSFPTHHSFYYIFGLLIVYAFFFWLSSKSQSAS